MLKHKELFRNYLYIKTTMLLNLIPRTLQYVMLINYWNVALSKGCNYQFFSYYTLFPCFLFNTQISSRASSNISTIKEFI